MIIASFWIYLLVLVCLVSLWNNICITQSWWQTYAKQTAQIFKKRLSFFILITVLLSNTLCPAWLIWMNDQWACQSSVRPPPSQVGHAFLIEKHPDHLKDLYRNCAQLGQDCIVRVENSLPFSEVLLLLPEYWSSFSETGRICPQWILIVISLYNTASQ